MVIYLKRMRLTGQETARFVCGQPRCVHPHTVLRLNDHACTRVKVEKN